MGQAARVAQKSWNLSNRVSTCGRKVCKDFPEQSSFQFCKLNFLRGL